MKVLWKESYFKIALSFWPARLFPVGSGFLYLPQCLHRIAVIYHQKGEDDKAISFLKAEKIYYETALIDSQAEKIYYETALIDSQDDGEV